MSLNALRIDAGAAPGTDDHKLTDQKEAHEPAGQPDNGDWRYEEKRETTRHAFTSAAARHGGDPDRCKEDRRNSGHGKPDPFHYGHYEAPKNPFEGI